VQLTDVIKGTLNNAIVTFAKDALRTICVAYKDIEPN
jgi:magnesium-transporting ATPase (P-type)